MDREWDLNFDLSFHSLGGEITSKSYKNLAYRL